MDELARYKKKNHFYLLAKQDIKDVCNAPDMPGVYVVFSEVRNKRELVYIGFTKGELANKRQVALGKKRTSTMILQTLSEEIMRMYLLDENNGTGWKHKMQKHKIDSLDIHWAVKMDRDVADLPEDVERSLMQKYIHANGCLPKWNALG